MSAIADIAREIEDRNAMNQRTLTAAERIRAARGVPDAMSAADVLEHMATDMERHNAERDADLAKLIAEIGPQQKTRQRKPAG